MELLSIKNESKKANEGKFVFRKAEKEFLRKNKEELAFFYK